MSRIPAPKSGVRLACVTANRLGDGAVVWLTASGAWSVSVAEAAAVAKDALPALLAQAAADEAANHIVAPYEVAVNVTEAGIQPAQRREQIRAQGPSIELPVDAASSGKAA